MPALTVRINVVGDPSAAVLPQLNGEVANQLNPLETDLDGRDYLIGCGLKAADVQTSFVGALATHFGLGKYPNVAAWLKRFQARPAYKAALARGGPYQPGTLKNRSESGPCWQHLTPSHNA